MNYWIDIASIVFICVTSIHLGLVKAVEDVTNRELRIVNCPKCFTWWSVLAYTIITSRSVITSLAISFLCSYIALWLELFEGFVDSIYRKVYEKIYPDPDDNEASADTGNGSSESPVS